MTRPGHTVATERSARVVASRKLLRRARRAETGQFLADGPQAVREAVRFHRVDHPRGVSVEVSQIFVTPAAAETHHDLLSDATTAGIRIVAVTDRALAGLSEAVTPQGIVAQCATMDRSVVDVLAPPVSLVAVPVEVRDPGNAGTIVRCADAAGADAVVFAGDSVDVYNSKTVRATAGSIFHVPVAVAPDPARLVRRLSGAGLTVIATEGEAGADLDEAIDTGVLTRPTAWLFGNEAHGLPDDVAALADLRVRIPIRGLAESLNLSTAAAICLFASARAHRA